ncbi:MAG: Wzz/FepE/Etk N-terminal domain-containing protein [Elusimicrobiota bacterium]|nr:Wzz/FepE/Etk N-terminal domain-containing protein [Elusimicrobiota bacterium]
MENPEERTSSFQELLQIISARKVLIIAGFLSVFVITAIGSFRMAPVYEISTTLMVEPIEVSYIERGSLSYGARAAFIANEKEIIKSRTIAEEVVRQLRLHERLGSPSFLSLLLNKFFQTNPGPFEKTVRGLRKSLFVSSTGGPNIIEIGLNDKDPVEGARIVNAVAQVYIEYRYEASLTKTRGAYNFIAEQVRIAQQKLNDSDRALREFKQKEKMTDLPSETAHILGRLSTLDASLSGELAEYPEKDPRVVRTKEEIERLTAKLESLPQKELELARLARAVKSNEEIYLILLRKLEDARISEVAEMQGMGSAMVIDPAVPPPYPMRRKRVIFILMGGIMSLVFAMGMAFFAEYRDSSMRTSRDIEEYLHSRVLGVIPSTPKNIRKTFLGFRR